MSFVFELLLDAKGGGVNSPLMVKCALTHSQQASQVDL